MFLLALVFLLASLVFLLYYRHRRTIPDYASLTGVPKPCPLPAYDTNRALPRPYRPLRWPYHQTMVRK